jgi:hypothetical protein
MGLLNYTTQISVEKTVSEIQAMLAKAKASAVLSEFDGCGNVIAISFKVPTKMGLLAFRLPCDPQAIQQVLNNQVRSGQIPKRFLNDSAQALRVGWRIIKQWLEAQLAIVETKMVTIDQVFLPYAQTASGETLYEMIAARGYNVLQLEAPKSH